MQYARPIAAIAVATALAVGIAEMPQMHWASMSAMAQSAGFSVGDKLATAEVHIINNPGRYGLGPPPAGSAYAVAHGMLIRIDPKSGQVLSIMRAQSEILD